MVNLSSLKAAAKAGRHALGNSKTALLRRLGLLKTEWADGLPEELSFWESALANQGKNWNTEEFRIRTNPQLELQKDLQQLVPAPAGATVRVLDVGAGPLTRVGKRWPGRTVELVALDPLAKEYNALLARLAVPAVIPVTFGHGEKLLEQFAANSFDLACAYNSLDHSYDPLQVIQQMLAVVKPQHYVYLSHFLNVGVQERYHGLHQWNFNLRQGELFVSDGHQTKSVAEACRGQAEVAGELQEEFGAPVVVARLKKIDPA